MVAFRRHWSFQYSFLNFTEMLFVVFHTEALTCFPTYCWSQTVAVCTDLTRMQYFSCLDRVSDLNIPLTC